MSDEYRGVKSVVADLVRDLAERRIDTYVSVEFATQIAIWLVDEVRDRAWFTAGASIWRQLRDCTDE
jgi:hypothetical protein